MKMANNILYAFAAALLMTVGCAKVEPENFQAEDLDITFQVGNYAAATKADAEPKYKALDEKVAFGTFCTFTPGAFADGNGTPYMQNVRIRKQGTGTDAWKSDVSYYWPKAGKLSFVSYAPYKEGAFEANPSADETGFYISLVEDHANQKYNIRFNNYTVDGSEDLMYSEQRLDLNANAENTYKNGFNGVPTLFHHALTKINIVIDCPEDITLEGIKFTNIATKGSYVPGEKNVVWLNPENSADRTLTHGESFFVLPQTLNAGEQQLVVNAKKVVTIDNEDFYSPIRASIDLKGAKVTGSSETINRWEVGKEITYTIKITSDTVQIRFTAKANDWGTSQGSVTI